MCILWDCAAAATQLMQVLHASNQASISSFATASLSAESHSGRSQTAANLSIFENSLNQFLASHSSVVNTVRTGTTSEGARVLGVVCQLALLC